MGDRNKCNFGKTRGAQTGAICLRIGRREYGHEPWGSGEGGEFQHQLID